MMLPRIDDHNVHSWGLLENALQWADLLEKYPPATLEQESRILLVAAYPWVMSSMLAYAVLLRRLGHHPTFLWMPYVDGIHDVDEDTLAVLKSVFSRLSRRYKEVGIEIKMLNVLLQASIPKDFVVEVQDMTMRDYFYTYHLDSCEEIENPFFFAYRYQRNLRLVGQFAFFMGSTSFDSILVPNGTVNEFGVINRYLQSMRVPHYNVEGANVKRVFVSANKSETCE